ncbi:MAG: beta-eliminating lyase-related protein [Halioglobus sp.]
MITPQLLAHYQKTRDACHYRLTGHPPMTMVEQLAAISEQARQYDSQDYYGQGELIESFETEIATLLGKESAVFLPSGTMAQCIALRVWADLAGSRSVGFHASSHLELHEHNAYETLYGLNSVLLGAPDRVVTLADLESVDSKLAAVLLELPMREIGGQLPNWQQLSAQSQWAREQGIALHMDGARLWQCPAYYGRDMAEIAALFDSVYVSFYKDIGGIAGSVLAGSADFIASARIWIRRAGGNLYALYPYVLSARAGMERNLAAMPECIRSASWLAAYLNQFDGVATLPLQPPTNLFHLQVPCDPSRLVEYACDWSERHKVFLLPLPRAHSDGHSIMEFSMGQAVQAQRPAQWESWLQDFFTHLPRDSN